MLVVRYKELIYIEKEIWKPANGLEDKYEVSNYGNVRNKYGRIFTPKKANNGYLRTSLGMKRDYTHRIVAQHFVDNPFSLPEVNHIDGDKTNNYYKNLEWVNRKQNCEHASRTGLINRTSEARILSTKKNQKIAAENAKRPIEQLDDNFNVIARYPSIKDASIATGIKAQNISQTANGKTNRVHAGGYRWRYL